jgi:hypothetical protein
MDLRGNVSLSHDADGTTTFISAEQMKIDFERNDIDASMFTMTDKGTTVKGDRLKLNLDRKFLKIEKIGSAPAKLTDGEAP